jgi:hypothetical protein
MTGVTTTCGRPVGGAEKKGGASPESTGPTAALWNAFEHPPPRAWHGADPIFDKTRKD